AAVRAGAIVGDLMRRDVVTVEKADPLRKAANLMKGHRTGCIPVVERGRVVGVVTIGDMLSALGRGIGRSAEAGRPPLHHRTPHKKMHVSSGRW
ncbi:MAG TPA: CBS domain-containing protein, partial [Vicinamibacterales bacterium]|nr:CBS domain-containing protein [Vicinamibacterales bacterium]